MKKTIIFPIIITALLLSGCMQSRYITEKFIKTKIENHKVGEFSSIKTYTIFKGASYGGSAYLELTGYKYENKKALIIGVDKYYMARQKFKGDQTLIADITYIELTLEQCKSILEKHQILLDKIKSKKAIMNETINEDFTISENLFISFRKSYGNSSVSKINLWINGDKYVISRNILMRKLSKFINY